MASDRKAPDLRRTSWRLVRHSAPVWSSLAVLVAAVGLLLLEAPFLVTLRYAVFDAYQRQHPRLYRPAPVRFVDIDDDSLERFGQWPWPRTTVAELIGRLRGLGAAAVALDVTFSEPDRTSPWHAFRPFMSQPGVRELVGKLPDNDVVLTAEIARGAVVVGFTLTPERRDSPKPLREASIVIAGDDPRRFLPQYHGAVAALPALQQAAAGNGAVNIAPTRDGVVRRLPLLLALDRDVYPTLAAEALRVAQGASTYIVKSSGASGEARAGGKTGVVSVRIGDATVATDPEGAVWMHYTEPVPRRVIAAWRVLAGEVAADDLEGDIVFVGTSAAGLKDLRLDARGRILAGAEIHAQAAEQILQKTFLTRPDWAKAVELLLTAALSLLLVVVVLRFGAAWAVALGTLVGTSCIALSWLAFTRFRLLLDPTVPALTTVAIYLVCSLSRQLWTERDRRFIRAAFSRYISPNLVRYLIDNPDQLNLGGERRDCSFVLTDLMGFTRLVEQGDPQEVLALLNEYLDGMVAVAFRHEGTVDRIVGDAVAVMFSAPVAQPDHAARAVACALEMDRFAQAFAARKRAAGVALGHTRIGVNTGVVTIGNVGGSEFVDYRALGDAVNTAARLENANRFLGTRVCVSGTTVAACPGFLGRPVGTLVLAGKAEGVETFEPLTPEEGAAPTTAAYRAAFELMRRDDPAAEDAFAALAAGCPHDPLPAFHLARLRSGERGAIVSLAKK